jgi:hypothetical protein
MASAAGRAGKRMANMAKGGCEKFATRGFAKPFRLAN